MASNSQSEFDKSKPNSPPMQSSKTPAPGMSGKSRGVENAIATDMALIGDTRHALHTAALPKKTGPNFGYGGDAPTDQFRVDCGEGVSGCL